MRRQRVVVSLATVVFVCISLILLRDTTVPRSSNGLNAPFEANPLPSSHPLSPSVAPPNPIEPPQGRQAIHPNNVHPVASLIQDAEQEFDHVRSRQSKTLADAVNEYRRRYNMHPPPHFDKWFYFAQAKGVQLTDEYDTIYHSLLPFWSLEPKTIRERAREALGYDNSVIGVLIRDGKVTHTEGGREGYEWQQDATVEMMNSFIRYLPDMDLVFNTHDEPRVIVPSDDLQRLVNFAKDHAIPKAFHKQSLVNKWSEKPIDLNKGDRIDEVRTTRFNRFAHQPTWTSSRASCPLDTPARSLNESEPDNLEAYAHGDLGFIYNTTAFSDICNTPSLRYKYGFFDRANAFDVVRELFPVFSQSKISSFQDILYPSPWYWVDKVPYEEEKDHSWDAKTDKLYWRGSTTGGFARGGGWRRQHRQRFVSNINNQNTAKVLSKNENDQWEFNEVNCDPYRDQFDVRFTYIGQCDPNDCAAQQEYFVVGEPAGQQDAWTYKYLVDIDGNAFSGRYYAFLRSHSLIFKIALFREWHDEWLKPWYVETTRYFISEDEGRLARDRFWNLSKSWSGLSHHFITLRNGFKFHYVANDLPDSPAADKPLVIFIHGFPDSWAVWRHLLKSKALQEAATLVAVDLPGYGGTDSLEIYSSTNVLENLAGFILAIRAKYGIDTDAGVRQRRTVIVSHDWGCVLSMRLAAEAPQLADRFILSNGPLTSMVASNISRLLSSSLKMFKTGLRSPIKSRSTLCKAIKSLKPVARQLLLSGYIFSMQLPMPFVVYLGTGGNYSFLKLAHKRSHGDSPFGLKDAAECMASSLGPSTEECSTQTSDGEGYPASVVKERVLGNFQHMARYYREKAATSRWQKSIETIADLHSIAGGNELHRTSSGAGLFDDGPTGVLKAHSTIIWGKTDIALDPQICLNGFSDYLVRNSQVVELPRSGHFTPLERESCAALTRAVDWAVGGEQEDIGTAIQRDYPDAVVTSVYDELIPVHLTSNHTPANLWLMERPDLISTFTKIELWKQTQFKRIVYIDCDVVAIRAPDELLALEVDFAAAPDVGWPDIFNSGVMVLRPNLQDYFALKALAERGISFDGADQGLLNMHFRDWHRLSFTYNCTPSANYQYIPAYKHFQSTISLVHFIGAQKPWNMSRQVSPAESPYNQLLGRWWTIYDRHYRPVTTLPTDQWGDASITSQHYSQSHTEESNQVPLPVPSVYSTPQNLVPEVAFERPYQRPYEQPYEQPSKAHTEVSFEHPPVTQALPESDRTGTDAPLQAPPYQETKNAPNLVATSAEVVQDIPKEHNDNKSVQVPVLSAVPQYVRGEEHVSAYMQPHFGEASINPHAKQPPETQVSIPIASLAPPSTAPVQVYKQQEEHLPGVGEHSHKPPTSSEPQAYEPPRAQWDPVREPPPLNTKPEGIALESKTYAMSEDKELFKPPPFYPEAPKNMYYEVPSTKPEPEKLNQIFPWENQAPKPTRVFLDDDQDSVSLPSSVISPISPKDTPTSSMGYTTSWTTEKPPETWDSYSRSNAWDDVPEIQRYIQSIAPPRRAKVQVLGGWDGHASQRTAGAESIMRLTDFPSEQERPSLPVTPAPIRRPPPSSNALGEGSTSGQLPIAVGVPNQEEWVGVTVDNPSIRLEELQRHHSDVLENPDLLLERIQRAARERRRKYS
ncbi:putative capsule-associated protein CAP1 [Aspergillus bertholletiae]|uniref:glycogenin glucosyltransferase n=1 Tax=Aspergillus bertholletiae TaxID=1226010 RepID=A0A5N7BPA4_9EURO|nr:putative capsule-associated protein CAP1 [Aspergillus bertholletiae]